MFFALLLSASALCPDFVESEFPVVKENVPIVEDAKRRWAEKTGDKSGMAAWFPIVIYAFGERCVYFRLRSDFTGGEPVYCYARDTNDFTRADDDIE